MHMKCYSDVAVPVYNIQTPRLRPPTHRPEYEMTNVAILAKMPSTQQDATASHHCAAAAPRSSSPSAADA